MRTADGLSDTLLIVASIAVMLSAVVIVWRVFKSAEKYRAVTADLRSVRKEYEEYCKGQSEQIQRIEIILNTLDDSNAKEGGALGQAYDSRSVERGPEFSGSITIPAYPRSYRSESFDSSGRV